MIRGTKTRSKDKSKSKRFVKDKQAVSPVIGVILMVAVTVVMAAIVGSFLYGFIGGGGAPPEVSATASYYERAEGGKVIVTYRGGADQDFVGHIDVNAWNESGVALNTSAGVTLPVNLTNKVGNTTMFNQIGTVSTAKPTRATNHVVVTAVFKDDSTSVILDTWV